MTRPRIAILLRSASGSSQPWHCRLEDGSDWLVKFAGAGPGRGALLAECIANRLGRLWGFPIPEAQPVFLDSSVARAGTDEFWDVLDGSAGWNLGIRTIENAVDVVPDEHLPRPSLEAMFAFDALLANWDRTALSRNLMRDDSEHLWWIDHGSCRFLHNLEGGELPSLPSTHFLYEHRETIEPISLPMLTPESIEALLADVPDEWIDGFPYGRHELGTALTAYLASSLAPFPQ